MVLAGDAENVRVAGEVDLDQHVLRGHVLQELVRAVLIDDVHAMSDAIGFGLVYREAHMAAQSLRRHEARRQFAGMQADVNFGIKAA